MIFGFLLAVTFDPTIWQGATAPRWALLCVALPILLYRQEPKGFTTTHLIGAALALWALTTYLWTPNKWDGGLTLMMLAVITQSFVYGSRLNSLKPIFVGLGVGLTISSLILLIPPLHDLNKLTIVQVYPHGLLGNRNMLAEAAALTTIGLLVYRSYWLIPGLLPCIFWQPMAMGGILAFAFGAFVWLYSHSKRSAILLAVAAALIGVFTIDFAYKLNTLDERIILWRTALAAADWFGHGIGSTYSLLITLTPDFDATLRRPDHFHNEALEILFELGMVGFALYAILLAVLLERAERHTPILVAFLIISSFSFSWHLAVSAFIGAIAFGHVARSGVTVRDFLNACGAFLRTKHVPASRFRKDPSLEVGREFQPVRLVHQGLDRSPRRRDGNLASRPRLRQGS